MSDSRDWQLLAERVKLRREELRLSRVAVQARGGPSTATLQKIENGTADTLLSTTKHGLEDALEWARGSVDRILAGGEPILGAEPAGTPRAEVLDPEGERLIIDIVAGVGRLSEADRREILALIRAKESRDTQV